MIALKQRLLAKVSPEPMSGCWLWTGAVNRRGYGSIGEGSRGSDRRTTLAHRAAWTVFRGPIPLGSCVLHRCDTPPCCNPAHLFLGSQTENIRDMCAKGRDRHPRGTSSGLAKISPESVAAIRLLRGKMSQARIAAAWGIAKSNVWSIQHGRTWVEGSR